jgi:acyl carrier protein
MATDQSLEQVSQRVRNIIVDKLGIPISDLHKEARFSMDFGVDSLDLYELIMELEREFRIRIPNEDIENLQTVGALSIYICSKLNPVLLQHLNLLQ